MEVKLCVEDLTAEYIDERNKKIMVALSGMSFEVREGEFVSIVGPSGCGKTTLLNCVHGLLQPSKGKILLHGRSITENYPDISMVFQSPSLLPWRSVIRNIAYGAEIRKKLTPELTEKIKYFVSLVGLKGFENFYPHELSGGMQQRVNLARALVTDPDLILLDEPFASLDAQTREFMQLELLKIWEVAHKTAIFVTHQINEAIFLSDRVLVLTARPGRVKEGIPINLPRPRSLHTKRKPEFLAIEDHIWTLIEDEVRKSGLFEGRDSL